MSRTHKIEILGSFAVAVCQERLSPPHHAALAENTVADSLNHVTATFSENGHNDPQTGCRAQRFTTSFAATEIIQEGRSKGSSAKRALPVCVRTPFL